MEIATLPDTLQVAVLGAGTMGTGIARLCLEQGLGVTLSDPASTPLNRAEQNLSQALGDARGQLRTTVAELDVAACDVVVDALPQHPAKKRWILERALAETPDHVPVGTLTLAQTVESLRPDHTPARRRVIGMHFMNPPHRLRICELIIPPDVDDRIGALARNFLHRIEIETVEVADVPGFVINRALMPLLLSAAEAVGRGQSAEEVDRLFVKGCGHPMGPLQVLDLVGLDVALQIAQVLASAGLADVPDVLEHLVAEGRLGRKSGHGFHTHPHAAEP